ncbi:hypothetical protein Tco_0496433 [Tanacetum coccineum]
MSETEPIPPTSSVTALRIPIIKKGEYDLWSMKMRQYIAINCFTYYGNNHLMETKPQQILHLLSCLHQKTSLAANARNCRSLWKAIKARFEETKAQRRCKKNLLKQQFETLLLDLGKN